MTNVESQFCNGSPLSLGRATDELVCVLYERLCQLARRQLSFEASDHSHQTGDLVHEVYLRLAKTGRSWDSPAHFATVAAETMRWILAERARSKRCTKRGGKYVRVPLTDGAQAIEPRFEEIVLVDDLIDSFQAQHPREAQLVQLHYFAGLSISEAGRVLGIPSSTAHRYWMFARAWLKTAVHDHGASPARREA